MVIVHDTISNQTSYSEKERVRIGDVVLEHYRRVAGSLTFGKTSLTANGHLKPGPGRLPATLARIEAGQQFER